MPLLHQGLLRLRPELQPPLHGWASAVGSVAASPGWSVAGSPGASVGASVGRQVWLLGCGAAAPAQKQVTELLPLRGSRVQLRCIVQVELSAVPELQQWQGARGCSA